MPKQDPIIYIYTDTPCTVCGNTPSVKIGEEQLCPDCVAKDVFESDEETFRMN